MLNLRRGWRDHEPHVQMQGVRQQWSDEQERRSQRQKQIYGHQAVGRR